MDNNWDIDDLQEQRRQSVEALDDMEQQGRKKSRGRDYYRLKRKVKGLSWRITNLAIAFVEACRDDLNEDDFEEIMDVAVDKVKELVAQRDS